MVSSPPHDGEPALPAPASCLHSSPAATTPGTCLEMELGRHRGMRPLPAVQQRPSLAQPPRPPFCCSEGKPCRRAASSILLLPPPPSPPRAFVLLSPSRSFPGPYLPLPVVLLPLLFLPQGLGATFPPARDPPEGARGPPSAGNRDPRGSPAATGRGRAATPPLIG